MRLMGIIFRCGCVFLLGMAAVFVEAGGADNKKQKNITAAEMREDLRYFARELPKRHKNAFHYTPEDRFRAAIDDLDAHLDTMDEDAFYVGLKRIASLIGDAHTQVNIPVDAGRAYPIAMHHFEEGYRVLQVGPGLERALGTRVLKIGQTPADSFFAILSPLAAQNENPTYAPAWVEQFLHNAQVLHGAGITENVQTARFTFEDDAGQQFTLDVPSIPAADNATLNWVLMNKTTHVKEISEPMRNPAPTFSYTYIPEARTVYAEVRNMVDVSDPAKELFGFIREKQPD